MDYLDLIDSSRKLFSICAISFIINLCLTLHICVQTFDVIDVKKKQGVATLRGCLVGRVKV
jgi:hypothetical protein